MNPVQDRGRVAVTAGMVRIVDYQIIMCIDRYGIDRGLSLTE